MKKRKNFIFKLDKNVDVNKNMKILVKENHDPDIWLGMLELEDVNEEFNKRRKLDIENGKEKYDNSKTYSKDISYTISKLAVPTIATVIFSSLGFLPGLDGLDNFDLFNSWKDNNNTSITSNIDENIPEGIVFNCRVLDGTKTIEIDNFAVTRNDNDLRVAQNTIAPGTSGVFVIEIDATRNARFTSI